MEKILIKEYDPNKKILIMDFDDTFCDTQILFHDSISKLGSRIKLISEDKQIPISITSQVFLRYNSFCIKKYGYSEVSFLEAIRLTNNYFCNLMNTRKYKINNINNETLQYLNVYNKDPKFYFFEDKLIELSEFYNLYIFTKGCEKWQLRKIQNSGIFIYLNGVFINQSKLTEDWVVVLNSINNKWYKNDTTVIGDSILSDILPIYQIVNNVYWIKHYAPFFLEEGKTIKDKKIKSYECGFLKENNKETGLYKIFMRLLEGETNVNSK